MNISVDVGYSQVKAVADNGRRVQFPSAVAPARQDPVHGIIKESCDYRVGVRSGLEIEEKLVGCAALQSAACISTVAREKPAHIHDLLVTSAAYLLGAGKTGLFSGDKMNMSLGLPLAYFRSQREELRHRILGLGCNLKINEGPEKYISFQEVQVYPQGLGILLGLSRLPERGLVGMIDIGCYTSDYLVFEMNNGHAIPIPEACGSVEAGVQLIESSLKASFQAMTGAALPSYMMAEAMELAAAARPLRFQGRDIDLALPFKQSCRDTGRKIVEEVRNAWGRRAEYLNLSALAGGGAIVFKEELRGAFPDMITLADPAFANAEGFLRLACA